MLSLVAVVEPLSDSVDVWVVLGVVINVVTEHTPGPKAAGPNSSRANNSSTSFNESVPISHNELAAAPPSGHCKKLSGQLVVVVQRVSPSAASFRHNPLELNAQFCVQSVGTSISRTF